VAAQQRLDAIDPFFRQKTVELLGSACEARRRELDGVPSRKATLDREIGEAREECRRLKNEIEHAGGERLRHIPLLIRSCELQAAAKREADHRYRGALHAAGMSDEVTCPTSFVNVQKRLGPLLRELGESCTRKTGERDEIVAERGTVAASLREEEAEFESLVRRQGNLPETSSQLRRMCEELGLSEKDLPFAAELIAVNPEERAWEASAEMILRGFALSLLVPERHYQAVSRYVDRTRLAEGGRGQKLSYTQVGERSASGSGASPHPNSLLRKLLLREHHPLLPWLRAELADRFDYRCCDTIEEFQEVRGLALTRQRHVKGRGARHEKDDREFVTNPRHFVLGWDNAEKRRCLAEEIRRLREQRESLDRRVEVLDRTLGELRARQEAARTAHGFVDFGAIDYATHEREVETLRQEQRRLEEQNDALRLLKERLVGAEAQVGTLTTARDASIRREGDLEREIADGDRMVANAEAQLRRWRADGTLDHCAGAFAELETLLSEVPLAADSLFDRERTFRDAIRASVERLRGEIEPLKGDLYKLMSKFLRECPEERKDLEADINYLETFLGLWEQIRRDDLPRHERRFKERLNEKVTQEIGLLNAALQTERSEIVSRIGQLNESLRQVEYRPGTHMQLEPRLVRVARPQ
jgi:uncharacterized protein YPO0396